MANPEKGTRIGTHGLATAPNVQDLEVRKKGRETTLIERLHVVAPIEEPPATGATQRIASRILAVRGGHQHPGTRHAGDLVAAVTKETLRQVLEDLEATYEVDAPITKRQSLSRGAHPRQREPAERRQAWIDPEHTMLPRELVEELAVSAAHVEHRTDTRREHLQDDLSSLPQERIVLVGLPCRRLFEQGHGISVGPAAPFARWLVRSRRHRCDPSGGPPEGSNGPRRRETRCSKADREIEG
jgi:hypothetical protein